MPDTDETTQAMFERLYERFNARDIDGVLAHLASDVDWPNGWEGGYVKGHDEVRDYWTRQWAEIDSMESCSRTPPCTTFIAWPTIWFSTWRSASSSLCSSI